MKSYVDFVETEKRSKTSIYEVRSKSHGDVLGQIKWHGPWRQYCFFPNGDTLWSWGCLEEIQIFINNLMLARKG